MDEFAATVVSQRRMRATHILASTSDEPSLIYDLERTYVIEVPEHLRRFLDRWPPKASIHPSWRDWLIEKGLFTDAPKPDWSDRSNSAAPRITDVSLDLPSACNMGCHYCFEKPIHSRIGLMREDTLLATLDFTFKQAADSDHIALHFGSGEPLIEFDLLRRLVRNATARTAATGQKLTFELTTNATLVTPEIAAFFADHPFNIRVSCDGPAKVHDRYRPMANGRDSYPLVERGLRLLLQRLPDRVTVNTVLCDCARIHAWRRSGIGRKSSKSATFTSSKSDLSRMRRKRFGRANSTISRPIWSWSVTICSPSSQRGGGPSTISQSQKLSDD